MNDPRSLPLWHDRIRVPTRLRAPMNLGIPYGYTDPEAGQVTCPACGATFPESYDPTGERLSDNYGEHYQKEHAK